MAVFMALPIMTTAAEISPLRFTDVDGFIALRYFFDEYTTSSLGVDTRKESNPTFQQEFALNSHAYVYHPNMLNMNLGGSVQYDQNDFETLDGESSSDTRRFNYFAYLDFLEKKPYPLTLYYDQQNPTVSSGLAGRFVQENTKYGFNFSVLKPFSPVQVTMEGFRLTSLGEGLDQIVDDVHEQGSIRFYHSYGSGNFAELSHQINKYYSESGSPNLEIVERIYKTKTSVLNSRNVFGAGNQVQLNNNLTYSTQDEFPERKDLRFNPNLTWRHSENMNSFYRYDFSDTDEELQETNNRKLTLGIANSSEKINTSFDLHGENNETTGLDFQNYGTNLSINYRKPVSIGEMQLTYAGIYDRNDQKTTVDQLQVLGEEHVLSGTSPQDLSNEFIITDDLLLPVEVFNISRTQEYFEDLDYRLIVIGSSVQIQRLTGGNILDGQTVLVDYYYETGGTFKYNNTNQNIGLNLSFSRYYDLYLRYAKTNQQLLEGSPTVSLNSINRSSIGMRADKPMRNGMSLGGEVSYENNNEDINPYVKQNYDAFIQLPLPKLTDVRFSVRQVRVDNESTDEDEDLNGYILRISSQPWLRTRVSYESSYEEDTGGSVDRLLRNHRLLAGWRIRQLSVNFNAYYSVEEQGNIERERWAVKLVAKREFK